LPAESGLDSPKGGAGVFRPPLPAEREGWAQIAAFVTNDPGPVYSDNVGLLLVAGKEVRYTDPFSLSYAAATGQWDQRELVARVERGEFSLIALRYDVFATSGAATDLTPELFEAIRGRYRVVERNVLYLYVPRSPLGRGAGASGPRRKKVPDIRPGKSGLDGAGQRLQT